MHLSLGFWGFGVLGCWGHVERARMGRAIGADQPRPVDGEAHRQRLDRHVMHDLVVAALEEG